MIPVPLSVRLKTSRQDRHVTAEVQQLRFREIDIGGFASAELTIARPLGMSPEEFGRFSKLYVYGHGVRPVWEGRVEDLGSEAGPDGEVWRIAAVGGMAHTTDQTVPLIYVEDSLDRWILTRNGSNDLPGGTMVVAEEVGGDQTTGIWLRLPTGIGISVANRVAATYYGLAFADQELALFDAKGDAGVTDADWRIQARTEDATVVRDISSSTGGFASSPQTFPNFSVGQQYVSWLLVRVDTSTTTSTNDVTFVFLDDVRVRAVTYGADGTKKTSGYTAADLDILASTVVEDLLGRLLGGFFDGANAVVDASTYTIRQLAWPEGITPRAVLDHLLELEPTFRWGVYESGLDGLYRFEWVQRPAVVSYEVDADAGFAMPSSSAEIWNAVRVFYQDHRDRLTHVRVTSTVAELAAAGLTRETSISVGGPGNSTDATQLGEEFLAEHSSAPAQGRLTVARPIQDLIGRRMVYPWEIKAGELIRVRPLSTQVAALTATDRDGESVFRIVARDYDAGTGTAVLELDEYPRAVSRALAAAARGRRRRR